MKNIPIVAILRLYRGSWILIQDNDPKHTCKKVSDYFKKADIKVWPDWPAASPDINPIENIWGIMKNEVSKIRPKTIEELKDAIMMTWNRISHQFIINCIESMPRRLKLIISSKGCKIPY